MKMWFLLVTTVARAVLADTGYQYDAPNMPFNLPSNQLANSYPIYNSQRYLYDKENEIRSNMFLKKENVHNYNGIGNPNYVTGNSNNGYTTYNQIFSPVIPFNNNYAQGNIQQTVSPHGNGQNVGYLQAPPLPINNNPNLNSGSSYNLLSTSLNQNSGYTHSLSATSNNNYNNGYSQSYPPLPITQQNTYSQHFTPITANNVHNNFVNTAATAGNYHHGYSQVRKPEASVSTTNGYNQAAQITGSLKNAYSQSATSSVGANINSGYAYSFTPHLSSSNNGYTQTATSSNSNQLNSGYGQTLAPATSVTISNVYEQSLTTSSSTNLKTGHGQTASSSTASGVNSFVNNPLPNAGSNSNSGYSQPPTGPTHIDLNSDLTVTSTSTNSNNGIIQKSLERVVTTSPANSRPSSPNVTPVIHKHIYFHVPPPEIEAAEKTISPPLLPKKNYKILFIKMPSQESKSNLARLQEQMRNAAIEDRTLIYVLVKKPEEPKPVALPKPKPSDHQVFFVKYNDSPFDIAARVNEELDKTGQINSIVPLQPGLVNGQNK